MSKVKVIGNENVKIVFFRAYLRQRWIDLCQAKSSLVSSTQQASTSTSTSTEL